MVMTSYFENQYSRTHLDSAFHMVKYAVLIKTMVFEKQNKKRRERGENPSNLHYGTTVQK
jgi:hypothetical protein